MSEFDYDELARADLVEKCMALQHNVDVLNAEVANLRPQVANFNSDALTSVFNEWIEYHGIDIEDSDVEDLFSAIGLKYGGRLQDDGVLVIRVEGCPHVQDLVDEAFVSEIVDAVVDAGESFWHDLGKTSSVSAYVE